MEIFDFFSTIYTYMRWNMKTKRMRKFKNTFEIILLERLLNGTFKQEDYELYKYISETNNLKENIMIEYIFNI